MKKQDTKGQTENFVTANVKLITFIVCMAIFLAVLGPFGYVAIKKNVSSNNKKGLAMTESIVVAMSKDVPTMEELKKYTGEETYKLKSYMYFISFDHFMLCGTSDSSDGELLTLVLSENESGEKIDVMTGDVEAFFNQYKK